MQSNPANKGRPPAPPSPDPQEIRALREKHRLFQDQACALIYVSVRSWQEWEHGTRPMHAGLWELFQIRVAELAKDGAA